MTAKDIDELAEEAGERVELNIETTPYGYAAIITALQRLQGDEPQMAHHIDELIDEIETDNLALDRKATRIASRAQELEESSDIDFGMVPEGEE